MKNKRQKSRFKIKKYEAVTIIIFITMVCLLSFIITTGLIVQHRAQPADAAAIETLMVLNATVTPTPFQPLEQKNNINISPTPTLDPGVSATPSLSPTPTLPSLEKPEGQVNILLLGSDLRPDDGGFRTDVIMWVSLNPSDHYVSVVSFPRDLYVSVPGRGNERINIPFQFGGLQLLGDTFEQNFDVRPDHYVMVDFNGFRAVIDSLGGIDVQAAQNLTDVCPKWINPSGTCSVGPGLVHMDSEVALWYARARHSTSDFDRARRTQEVVEAIFRRLISLDVITKADQLYAAYRNYVQTDRTLSDILPLLPFASEIYNDMNIRQYVIQPPIVTDWTTPNGAMVLLPDYEAIQHILIEALNLTYAD